MSRLLLFAAAMGLAWGAIGLSQPALGATAGPQMNPMAAKAAARRAASKPNSAPPAPADTGMAASKGSSSEAGHRDPFFIPPEAVGAGEPTGVTEGGTGPLPPGKRGLVVSQLRLEGVVKQSDDKPMIAVVANSTNRAYFLHENDEVYNGVVSKITPDSVYFTENVRDASGQMSSRQVIKKLGSGPGENR